MIQQLKDHNLSDWSDAGIIAFHFLLTATYSFVLLLPSVLGEEFGWRGFLVPELAKFMSFTNVALTSGLIWSVWHWPMMFKGFYGNVFLQRVFAPLTVENDSSAWYVDEFGAVPALVAFVIAIYFWKKGKAEFNDLSPVRNTATD